MMVYYEDAELNSKEIYGYKGSYKSFKLNDFISRRYKYKQIYLTELKNWCMKIIFEIFP
jgi:hypothetical protein